ncbi:MATE family efflux transporter [Pontibacter virosus]|nr:MATE family efflux transporter [Pontibacter virosus]
MEANKEQVDIPVTATLRDKMKIVLLLAFPAVVENFFQTFIGFVDVYFVSKIGLAEVSAIGATNAVLAIYFAVFMAIGVAANVRVANALGANQVERARHIAQQAIILSILFGILTGIVTLFFARPLLTLMGLEEQVLDIGEDYFRVVGIPSVFMSLMFALSANLRGSGNTRAPMKVSIIINIFHALLGYALIFGFWIFPEMGVTGAALATVASRVLGTLLLVYYIQRSEVLAFRKDFWSVDWGHQKELATLGSPAAGEVLIMRAGQIVYFGFIVSLGTNVFAAHQIAGNVEVISYMAGYGFATAVTILAGQQIGAGRIEEAISFTKIGAWMAVGIMGVLGLLLFFLGEWAGSLFSEDPEVISKIGNALKVSGAFQPFLAALLTLTGAYQAANNTKFPMYLTAAGMWAIRTVLVYYLGITLGWGLIGVWIAIGIDIVTRAGVLAYKFAKGTWMNLEKEAEVESQCHPQSIKETMSDCINNY